MRRPGTIIAALAAAWLAATPAHAHHSRSNFDLESVIEIEGVVTEFTWSNPHAFAVVESSARGETEEWTFELNSTPVLRRFGWSPDTLEVGDRVVARGNPDRDADRRFVYANVFVRDGEEIWAWGGPQTRGPQTASEAQGSDDFSGVWRIRFRGDVLGRNAPDDRGLVTTLPVNAKGRAQVDAFDPADNPTWDCAPESLPTILGHPYPFEIVRDSSDRLLMRYEVNNLERIVHLGAAGHPENVEPTPLGHSIGRIEDGELVVHTVGFTDIRWGNGRGVDSSTQKATIERYGLSDDGTMLSLTFTMRDPEYLTEPVTIEHDYTLLADYELQDYVCDPETSRRHLTAGEEE